MPLFKTISEVGPNTDPIRKRAYGMIEVTDQRLVAIHFRPWPKLISTVEALWIGGWKHKQKPKTNSCKIYYNQPIAHRNYLALAYVESTSGTSYATLLRALYVLDHVAMLKRSDAIICEVTNDRLSDRFLRRRGWEPYMEASKKRHWIRRFYGDYSSVEKKSLKIAELAR